jgi:hypothetical protein
MSTDYDGGYSILDTTSLTLLDLRSCTINLRDAVFLFKVNMLSCSELTVNLEPEKVVICKLNFYTLAACTFTGSTTGAFLTQSHSNDFQIVDNIFNSFTMGGNYFSLSIPRSCSFKNYAHLKTYEVKRNTYNGGKIGSYSNSGFGFYNIMI